MFKNLTSFAYKRNTKEAIGFYIGYLVLIFILAYLIGASVGVVSPSFNSQYGFQMGNIVAIITTLMLSFLILSKKRLLNNFSYLLLALLSGVLAVYGGGLLGLIPTAYLSTK